MTQQLDLDCRVIVEQDLGQPKHRGARSWMWKCPLHGEHKGASLAVWADGWKCFGACNTGGDAIAWVMAYRKVDFKEALRILGSDVEQMSRSSPARRQVDAVTPPSAEWQAAARAVVAIAHERLLSADGWKARAYLEARGLRDDIIVDACLGYVPGRPQSWVTMEGLSVPAGLLIPWFITPPGGIEEIWQLKVRVAAGDPKYLQVAGGCPRGLYWVDRVRPGQNVVVTEGEFDCLIIGQAGNKISPVALGSASNSIHPMWIERLFFAPKIWARMDDDDAGKNAEARLQGLSARVRSIGVPDGCKDVNELYVKYPGAFWEWLRALHP